MLKNYLLVALRNLKRNKVFSLINIMGLALGMACSLFILLWVQDEKSIDAFHKNGNRLYYIYQRQFYDGKIDAGTYTPGLLADEMKKVLPDVEYASGLGWYNSNTFQAGEKIMKEQGTHAGADFFKMFSFPILQGNAESALNTPLSIAISRKMAIDFFGSPAAAIGKTLRFNDAKDFKVTAVYENIPINSSLQGDYILSWQEFLQENEWAKDWGNNGPKTVIALRSNANPVLFEKKITQFLDKYNKEQSASFRVQLGIQRFDDQYLHSEFKNGKPAGGRIAYVKLFSLVAIFILVIACINFMNLTTARSVKRAKEIGIRKVVGAIRSALMRQFIGEAILLSFISVILAFIIVLTLLPTFNNLTGKHISLPFNNLSFLLGIIGLTVLTGFLSGSYPALFLSRFNPVYVLKGAIKIKAGSAWFRKSLVVFQFVLSIILIIGTIIISKQVDYMEKVNLGFEKENLVYIPIEGELKHDYTLFKQQALTLPGVQRVSRIYQVPTSIDNGTGGVDWDGKDESTTPMFIHTAVGYDFAKTLELTLQEGRDFSKDFATDSVAYILNETAVKKIGYKNPIGKRFTQWRKTGAIIGVLKDFHFHSLHDAIEPLVIRLSENEDDGSILVRTQPGKTKEAIASLEKLYKQLNPKFPFSYKFSDEEYQKLYQSEETVHQLSGYFAFLGIFISCLGLLGLVMFTAEQRIKEIGIRKVLGASIPSIFTLLSKEFVIYVLIAFIVASPLAWLAMDGWLRDYAYRITIGWQVFLIAGISAMFIALFTVSFQAIKASIANPIKSLRTE